jgi:two-component system OmpR family response regulator
MRLLVVEDDWKVGRALRKGFSEASLDCQWVRDGERGLELAKSQQFDAIVLDLLLPGRNGLEVLKELRGAGILTPVILLTALGTVAERVAGLSAGADDYLVKPFAFKELMARIQAVCRRAAARASPHLEVGDLSLNLASRRLTRGGKEILISPTEFSLIEFLMRHAGEVVSRKMLCEAIWYADGESMTNVVEVHINRLRNKLDRGFEKSAIETIRGRGYVIRSSADAPSPPEDGNDR